MKCQSYVKIGLAFEHLSYSIQVKCDPKKIIKHQFIFEMCLGPSMLMCSKCPFKLAYSDLENLLTLTLT